MTERSASVESVMEGGHSGIGGLRDSPVSHLVSPFSGTGRIVRWLSIAVVALVPLIQAFRGVDMTDTGFLLTNQQLIFADPASVAYWFHLWLTNIVGGLVYLAFGNMGLLPFKIAAAVLFWGLTWCAFRLFRSIIHRDLIWCGTALGVAFNFAGKLNIVHYNNLSVLFYGLGICCLAAGIADRRAMLVFGAGLVLTLNAFVRLPNAVGAGFIFVVPLVNLLGPRDTQRYAFGWRQLAAFSGGCAVAILLAFSVMGMLGHQQLYFDSLHELASAGQSGSNYAPGSVLLRPVNETVLAIRNGAVFATFVLVAGYLTARLGRAAVTVAYLAAIAALLLNPVGAYLASLAMRVPQALTIAGAGYLAIVTMLVSRAPSTAARLRLPAALVGSTVLALNIGSDTGILVSSFAFPLLIPLVLHLLVEWSTSARSAMPSFTRRGVRHAALYCGMTLAVVGRWTLTSLTYRDTSRFQATVHLPMLGGVFTSAARADALERTVPAIQRFVHPGDRVLIFDSLGLLHFVTRTKPYLDNPWPALYTEAELESKLLEKERLGTLPYVVLARHNARSATWPLNSEMPVMLAPVRRFIERNGLREVWANDVVAIFAPQ